MGRQKRDWEKRCPHTASRHGPTAVLNPHHPHSPLRSIGGILDREWDSQ